MPAPVWLDPSEVGTVAGWGFGSVGFKIADIITVPDVSTTSPHDGTYVISLTSVSDRARILDLTSATLGTTQGATGGSYIKIPTSLPAIDVNIFSIGLPSGRAVFLGFQASSGKLYIKFDTGSAVLSANAIVADTWYWVDVKISSSASPHVADWRIDRVPQTQVTQANTTGNVTSWGWGHDELITASVHYDNPLVSSTIGDYPLGPHKIVLLKVDTAGTATEIGTANSLCRFTSNGSGLDTTFNSADILNALGEAVPFTLGGSASGVYQRTSGSGNFVRIPMTSYTLLTGESISGVQIAIPGWAATTTANNLVVKCFDGTNTDTIFPSADPAFDASTTQPGWLRAMYNPSGGWTQAKLDALCVDIGGSTDISPVPGAHAVYAMVAVKQPIVTAVGQVTETDTAQAITARKTTAVGQVTETDTAQAISVVQGGGHTVAVGQATETDTAQSLTVRKTAALAQVTETDTARAVTAVKALAVGQVTEADTARAMTALKTVTVGQAAETDTARPVTSTKRTLTGQVGETDTAGTVAALKSITVGQAPETDTAMPVVRGAINTAVGQVTEVDAAQPITAGKASALGKTIEVDTSQPMSVLVQGVMSIVVETDTAQPIGPAKTSPLGQATETDVAQPITAVSAYPLDLVAETDTAQPISAAKSVSLVQVVEIDSAQPITVAGPTLRGTMTDFGPCAPWTPIFCQTLPTGSEAVSGSAIQAATEILWQGTQQRFGLCTTTIRPCRRSCYGDSWPFSNMWWQFGTYPQPVLYAGAWYNMTCGSCPDTCSCGPLEETVLPVPVQAVTQVMLGGSPMPTGSYRVDDNRKLVRIDGGRWPVCQNLVAADTELNTWSVTVVTGELVPTAGQFAVGELAIDYMKLCLGTKCEFPKWATSVTRADVQLNFPDFTDLLNLGLEGLPLTDRFLRRYNPHNLNGVPGVYDLDGAPAWRRTGT